MGSEKLNNHLRELGFYRSVDALAEIKEQAEKMVENAGSPAVSRRFEALRTFLSAESANKKHELALTIDVGGTNTKAGIRAVAEDGATTWRCLFEQSNDQFRADPDSVDFQRFCDEVCRAIASQVGDQKELPLGIVWSNALESKMIPELGITGIVTQCELHDKGEWFLPSLSNGMDIGAAFVEGLRKNGLTTSHLVVSNDTPLVMKALEGANAGIVASTGVNGTLVVDSEICNGELGGRFQLEDRYFSNGDILSSGEKANTIEKIISGCFLPGVMLGHLQLLSPHFVELSQLVETPPSMQDISNLGRSCSLPGGLARALLSRSAKLSAIVIYASLYNQLTSGDQFLVALDSKLASENQVYWDEVSATLPTLLPESKSIELVLIKPIATDGGDISVAMQGAANALDNLL